MEQVRPEEKKTKAKIRVGKVLLVIVVFCWIAVPILPFLQIPYKAFLIPVLLVGGEVLFVVTLALLGKTYWRKLKTSIFQFFGWKKKRPS